MKILIPNGRGRDLTGITEDFNEIEIYAHDDYEVRKAKIEQWIAKQVGRKLVEKYRGRQWKVIVNLEGQILIVACDSISNHKGYHIHMSGRTVHDLQEKAVMAAGEILERHNLARSRHFNPEKFEELPRDFMDDVIATDSAPEASNA